MSTTIIATLASLLAVLLPKIGVSVGTEELTSTIQTLVVVISGVWIWFQRVKRGDVTTLGVRKV